MGRKKAFVWDHFTINKAGKSIASICKYCSSKSSFANATRMLKHLSECTNCPETLRTKAQKLFKNYPQRKLVSVISSDTSDEDIPVPTVRTDSALSSKPDASTVTNSSAVTSKTPLAVPSLATASMQNYVVSTSSKQKIKIDEALARAVYMSGLPFNILENPYWKCAINQLRPSYEPPSAYRLRTPLLVAEYETVMQCTKAKVKSAECIGIVLDGWTNVNRENILNFILTTPEPVFLKAIPPGKSRETTEFLFKEICKVIESLLEDGVDLKRIFILITDNAANMRAAWAKVVEKYPHIVAIGCCAHSYDLLLTDIMKQPTLVSLKDSVKSIVKEFQNHHVIHATFKSFQKEKYGQKTVALKFPPKTRWYYFVDSLFSLKMNKAALQCTAIEDGIELDPEVKRNLFDDDGFWRLVNEMYDMLYPIAQGILTVEGDKTVLSVIPHLNKKIERHVTKAADNSTDLSEIEKKTIKKAVVERLFKCVAPVHFAANLLDPRRKGIDLDATEMQGALKFIGEQSLHLDLDRGKVVANLAEFRTKCGFFSDENIWESATHISPSTWWAGFCTAEALYPIAQRLFQSPTSSASAERNWSLFGDIHSKKRNRTLKDRVEKQVAIKSNMKFTPNFLPKKIRKNHDTTYKFCDDLDNPVEAYENYVDLDVDDWDWDSAEEYSVSDSAVSDGSDWDESDEYPLAFLD